MVDFLDVSVRYNLVPSLFRCCDVVQRVSGEHVYLYSPKKHLCLLLGGDAFCMLPARSHPQTTTTTNWQHTVLEEALLAETTHT